MLRAAVSQHRKFLYLETVSTCDGQVHRSSRNDDDHQKTNVEFVWPRGSRAGWQYRLPNYSVVFGTCATRIYHIFAYFFILFQKWKCSCHGAFNVNLRLANHATHFFLVQSHPIQSSSDGEKGPSNRRNNRIEISKFDMERHVVAQTHSEHIV